MQTKISFAFGSASELIKWVDLSGTAKIKPEEFLLAVRFFVKGATFSDSMLIFKQLDTNNDGFLDEKELQQLLLDSNAEEGAQKKALSYRYKDDVNSDVIAAEKLEDLLKSKDRIFKTVMPKTDELDLPMFIKARREKYLAALLGKEVAVLQIKA